MSTDTYKTWGFYELSFSKDSIPEEFGLLFRDFIHEMYGIDMRRLRSFYQTQNIGEAASVCITFGGIRADPKFQVGERCSFTGIYDLVSDLDLDWVFVN